MEFSDVVRRRRMVRAYDRDRAVSQQVLTGLLDHAVRAPSAGFSQGWEFIVLRTPADVGRFWTASTDVAEPDRWLQGMRTAPVLVLCLSDPERYLDRYAEPDKGWDDRDPSRWPVPYWDVDTGMAALLILLAAVDAGLVGCFFAVPAERQAAVLAEFGAPSRLRTVAVVSLGYLAAEGTDRRSPSLRRGRRPLTEVAHDGSFTTSWPST